MLVFMVQKPKAEMYLQERIIKIACPKSNICNKDNTQNIQKDSLKSIQVVVLEPKKLTWDAKESHTSVNLILDLTLSFNYNIKTNPRAAPQAKRFTGDRYSSQT